MELGTSQACTDCNDKLEAAEAQQAKEEGGEQEGEGVAAEAQKGEREGYTRANLVIGQVDGGWRTLSQLSAIDWALDFTI